MNTKERSRDTDKRPKFECRFDRDSGELDEKCMRDYLERTLPLAV